ncbi:uncharacterized protein LOC129608176 isoform X2 [Condylostylus longicornis]|uniref:uncharacterized protein LOC129608176 isoform X2 n=1 Tax=Condylostylus longicornis TaxID=2530218 RepID=UPI00244E432F|nr:uncharacterized protein LOC129608176 isoform X2 [Condylostylus longicornis]
MEEILQKSITTTTTNSSLLLSSVIIDNSNIVNNNSIDIIINNNNNNSYYYDWPTKCINLTNTNNNNNNNNCRQIDYNEYYNSKGYINQIKYINVTNDSNINDDNYWHEKSQNNYWALLALILVFGTAAGNILVCLAIGWERRLQNVTNYFLMSLAITDLMVAILVMPLGILTLFVGYFPLHSEHCLVWICLDVLFCTASIMHLCTISVDRYLSLRYPMRFGRNKTRRRVTLKIVFVWLLSIAMSLPLSLMYSKNHASVLVNGTCQIPDPVYKLVGSIVCFYIPLGVMLLTYCLTVRLLARQQQNLGGSNPPASGWASGWLGQTPGLERRCTWRRLLKAGHSTTPNHGHSAASTDTELSNLDTHELWLPDSSIPEPTPSTMTALHQFGAEMLKLSRGLESVSTSISDSPIPSRSVQHSTSETLQPITYKATNEINNQNSTNNITPTVLSATVETGNKILTTSVIKGLSKQSDQLCEYEQEEKFNKQNSVNESCQEIYQNDRLDNNQDRIDEDEDLYDMENIERRNSSSFPSTHRQLMNFKKRRRASTSSPGKKYESPGTPPPFYRRRFFSLPKNSLEPLMKQSLHSNNDTTCKDSNKKCKNLINENKQRSSGEHLESILKKSSQSSSMRSTKQQHCYDKNRHMTDHSDYLQLPPPCTCPYFGDVPIKSALKQTEVKILSSTNNSFSTISLSSTSSLFPATSPTPITTTKISLKNVDDISHINKSDTTATLSNTCLQQHNNNNNQSISNVLNANTCNMNMKKSSPNNSYLSLPPPTPVRKLSYSKTASVVTWDSQRNKRRGSSFGGARTTLLLTPTKVPSSTSISHHHHQHHNHHHQQHISSLRRSTTLRHHNHINYLNGSNNTGSVSCVGGSTIDTGISNINSINGHDSDTVTQSPLKSNKISSSPCLLQRNATVRSHHSRNSSVISRNSSRHGRIIRLEQKATKVLGVVFFTFVILWAPFFVLNLLPTVCGDCEEKISHWVFDIVTWLGYASSMVNPIFYTIFNKVFRQAFKKVLLCQYSRTGTQGSAAGFNHWRPKR